MSQQVTVDYEGVSIQIQAECDTAIHSLCKIDKVLDRIHSTANTLETNSVKEYETYLMKSKSLIKHRIELFQQDLTKYQQMEKKNVNNHTIEYSNFLKTRDSLTRQSKELTTFVNSLTGSKLVVIDQMIEEGLLNARTNVYQTLQQKQNLENIVNQDILLKINTIEDVSLRELSYFYALKHKNDSFDSIVANAQVEYDSLLNKGSEKIVNSFKEELTEHGISPDILAKVPSTENTSLTIDKMNEMVNGAISDELVRKETLKVIIKAIKSRGFIVDTKKNLKIDKQKNVVKLVALKASGQKAEFEIQLNGKFMYHFDEYEGHACKKDIEPFLEDLKNIYDINILHEEITWENPDKISSQKYQYVNENKGRN